jgi:hypothetical protein
MKVERVRPSVFRVTMHAYELTGLVAAARWVSDGAQGELTEEARSQLKSVLASFDEQIARAATEPITLER